MTNAELKRRAAALDAIYAELPKIACKGECHTSCGPVLLILPPAEEMRLRSTPRTQHESPLTCPFLSKNKRCKAYEKRPLICRLFGIVDDPRMRCSYGCEPERYLTKAEAREFIRRVAEAAG